jgi:hypothetical protein
MGFDKKKLKKMATLDDVEKEIFTKDEIKEIHKHARQRAAIRRRLALHLSKVIADYMKKEEIGFNEFQRRLGVSSATASKLIHADGNVTLETIAAVSDLLGVMPELSFKKHA